MFTGIVEATGSISQITPVSGDLQIVVQSNSLDFSDVKLGDSIATNGVCLTVVELLDSAFKADVSKETLAYTQFPYYRVGQLVNLEKAMLPTTRFGGHIVSGHVDTVAEVTSVRPNGRAIDVWLSLNSTISKYIVKKGSVTIDGISLTVNEVVSDQFKLTIVPHTQLETTVNQLSIGSKVNLEVDVMARYLERLINKSNEGVSLDLLSRSGFIK